jgi:hypothetical protein
MRKMTKQQIYKKNARYLGKMNKKDRSFSKFILTVGFLTKNQQGNSIYAKLNANTFTRAESNGTV